MIRSTFKLFPLLIGGMLGSIGYAWLTLCACPSWSSSPSAGSRDHKEARRADPAISTWQFTTILTDPGHLPKPEVRRIWMDRRRTREEQNGKVVLFLGNWCYSFELKRKSGTKIKRLVNFRPETQNTPEYWARQGLAKGHKVSTVRFHGDRCDLYEGKQDRLVTRVWIRQRDQLALQVEILWNGKLHRCIEFRDIRVNPNLPDSLFTPPDNITFREMSLLPSPTR